jgi:GntR family transcriptional regulator, transcriptional repressor for pyruvate dehydrogenase complex
VQPAEATGPNDSGAASEDLAFTPSPAPSHLGRACVAVSLGEGQSRRLKACESLARDIVHDIVAQGLQTGDRLPPEAAMLKQYQTSRESLREGLRLLEVAGLITIRRGLGGGPFVGVVDPAHLGRTSSLYYHLAGGTYAELFDAWQFSEGALAERAARNGDRRLVRSELRPYLRQDDEGVVDLEEFVRHHTHFHAVVASMAGNRVLELLLPTVGQIVTHHIVVNADPRDAKDAIGTDHVTIARAIAAGHPRKAREAMERHVGTMAAMYAQQLGDRVGELIEWR